MPTAIINTVWFPRPPIGSGLYTWGDASHGQLGNNATGPNVSSPTLIIPGEKYKSISAQITDTFVVKQNGTLWGWGANTYGALSTGGPPYISYSTHVQVMPGSNDWKIVSNDNYCMFAIKEDGTLWFSGYATNGASGTGHASYQTSHPIQVGDSDDWTTVQVYGHTVYAIKTDGSLWSWGLNGNGQLGINSAGQTVPYPIQTMIGSDDWKYVNTNAFYTFAIKHDGTLWSWGSNAYGQLGHNDLNSRSVPTQVGELNTWKTVVCGTFHAVAAI